MQRHDRFAEGLAVDLAHHEVEPAALEHSQVVDRHDAGVLEPGGGLGLLQEARDGGGISGPIGAHALHRCGASEQAIVHHGVLHDDVEFMPKPVTPARLRVGAVATR